MNSTVNRSSGKSPREVMNTDFVSVLYNIPLKGIKNHSSKLAI